MKTDTNRHKIIIFEICGIIQTIPEKHRDRTLAMKTAGFKRRRACADTSGGHTRYDGRVASYRPDF
jgi:hypothetical protein